MYDDPMGFFYLTGYGIFSERAATGYGVTAFFLNNNGIIIIASVCSLCSSNIRCLGRSTCKNVGTPSV